MSKDRPLAEELAARQKTIEEREAAFAEREAKVLAKENESFVDGLVAQGKILPTEKEGIAAFMAKLGSDEVAFADGENPLDAYKKQLEARPKLVEFAELTKDKGDQVLDVAFAMPDGYSVDPAQLELHAKATKYQTDNPGTDYIAAVKAVG